MKLATVEVETPVGPVRRVCVHESGETLVDVTTAYAGALERAGEMYHSFGEIVERVSRSETLYPGDVLGSGTVGEGCGLELGQFLESGDTVSLHVDGLGTLTSTVT